MMIDVWIFILFFFVVLRLIVSIVNAASSLYLKPAKPDRGDFVSVLIPARNEADNLVVLLKQLIQQTYSNLEILVYDDYSTDNTPDVIRNFSEQDQRIKLIQPKPLPGEWLGKNFACHQLAGKARGAFFLFLDADVKLSSSLVGNALNYIKEKKLDLLSIFPSQEMKTWGEWITVPLMNWILLSLLPLALVRKSKRPSLAAANGQFMMFNAANYRQNIWHEQVKGNLVEDIVIIRRMKQMGYTTATLLGNNDVVCRMYKSFHEAIRGFSKNVIEFFGGQSIVAILFALLVISSFAMPFVISLKLFVIYVLMVTLMRIMISFAAGQSVTKNLLLHIPQMIAFVWLVIRGCYVRISGRYTWKGRQIR
ncbi:MAG: glycosyltransferase family 2 protein [Bacteroidales bacterium]